MTAFFLQLTDSNDVPIWVNINAVEAMLATSKYTRLFTSGDRESFYTVRETPSEILAMMTQVRHNPPGGV